MTGFSSGSGSHVSALGFSGNFAWMWTLWFEVSESSKDLGFSVIRDLVWSFWGLFSRFVREGSRWCLVLILRGPSGSLGWIPWMHSECRVLSAPATRDLNTPSPWERQEPFSSHVGRASWVSLLRGLQLPQALWTLTSVCPTQQDGCALPESCAGALGRRMGDCRAPVSSLLSGPSSDAADQWPSQVFYFVQFSN